MGYAGRLCKSGDRYNMAHLNNFTFEEITIGQSARYSKTVEERDIQLFAVVSGDVNPVHLDEAFAQGTMFGGRVAHGMLTGALISAALATELPGPGTVYLGQTLRFSHPVRIGDTLTIRLEVSALREDRGIATIACTVLNQDGTTVAGGDATVLVPQEKLELPRPPAPRFEPAP